MHVQKSIVAITTGSAGTANSYTSAPLTGRISDIQFVNTDMATTVDFTITTAVTAKPILSVSNVSADFIYAPRQAIHDTSGVELLSEGTNVVHEPICLTDERIKIVTAQGGNAKSGTFTITLN